MWVHERLAPVKGAHGEVLVLRGRTSGALVGGRSSRTSGGGYERLGTWRQLDAREFRVSYATSEAAALVREGGQLFALTFAHVASRSPERIHGRVAIRPRLTGTRHDQVYLYRDLIPIIHTGSTVYRLSGYALTGIWDLSAHLAGRVLTGLQRPGETHFTLDLDAEELVEAACAGRSIVLRLRLADGLRRVLVGVDLLVDALELTEEKPAAVWPEPACSDNVRACLHLLPANSLDLAACGEAHVVRACADDVGLRVRPADLRVARARAYGIVDARLGLDGDAAVLVGRARAGALIAATKARVAQRLETYLDRWLVSSLAVEKALRAATTAAINEAYAMPLVLVPALVVRPEEPQSQRDAVADALLDYLAGREFIDTAYGRTLADLTDRYRQDHVAAIRYFREQVTPCVGQEEPSWHEYEGPWLGAWVQIRVEQSTGKAAVSLFEID